MHADYISFTQYLWLVGFDHTSTKPRNPKSSYFLLLFSLLLFIWICFKLLKNLLLLVTSYAQITFHDESCSALPIISLPLANT